MERYRDAEIEVWAFDEHRIGLKPIVRKVWNRVGQRTKTTEAAICCHLVQTN
jgi:hypothetical protein